VAVVLVFKTVFKTKLATVQYKKQGKEIFQDVLCLLE